MNRTQRAVKKACHKAFNYAKKKKHIALHERNESSFGNFKERSENLKSAAKDEKALKTWHRKMVQDYAVNTLKEGKTA